ncbi:MAG TPA: DUF3187 family protein [Povalibacter sp.]|nr:DUF3187 family protein [Povalibacter sp.]
MALSGFVATAAHASPLPTRDQNPLLAGYGIPMPMPARLAAAGQWRLAVDLNWSSTAVEQTSATESLLVDAETRELRVTLGRGFADRWMLQLQLPYRYTDGGNLDSFIDGWHDFFGLPDGARNAMPRDRVHIAYVRDGRAIFDQRSSSHGFADMSAAIGYQLLANANTSLSAWLDVKLPTGDANRLTGSGATDVSALVAGEHRFGERWSTYGQLGITWLGKGDLFTSAQRSILWSALAGIDVNLWRGLDAKLQIDTHSAVLDDSALDFLGDAVVLTIGGAYRFESGWTVDAGVSEDILVDASPDVVFVLGLRQQF